jgi:PadR family transcriptional regulator
MSLSPELLRGSLDLMVLSVLADGWKYGYLIQQQLKAGSGDLVNIQAGTLYPVLHRLEKDKYVKARWEQTTGRPRKWYELTAAGRRQLGKRAEAWREYVECVQSLLAPAVAPPRPT